MLGTAWVLDLLTSRAFERVARLWARSASERKLTSRAFECVARLWARSAIVRARSASERKLRAGPCRAGSYHTRPENQPNDFEKVYMGTFWKSQKLIPNKKTLSVPIAKISFRKTRKNRQSSKINSRKNFALHSIFLFHVNPQWYRLWAVLSEGNASVR